MNIQQRKVDHIKLCQEYNVENVHQSTGFDHFHFVPQSVPIDEKTSYSTSFLGRKFSAPLLINGMTGGSIEGGEVNRRLAMAADKLNIPMGLGSQRSALENASQIPSFQVKKNYPQLFVIGNIGFAQIASGNYKYKYRQLIDMIEADAMAIHLNFLQEIIQHEGDRSFKNFWEQLDIFCKIVDIPIVVKEVGFGLDKNTLKRLKQYPIAAVDVGGVGGTSWSHIEGLRSKNDSLLQTSEVFRDWGIPTAYALRAVKSVKSDFTMIASGGIRNGLMVAKALALGANMVGIGLPLLKAALGEEEAPLNLLKRYLFELKITMQLTGSNRLNDLSGALVHGIPYQNLEKR